MPVIKQYQKDEIVAMLSQLIEMVEGNTAPKPAEPVFNLFEGNWKVVRNTVLGYTDRDTDAFEQGHTFLTFLNTLTNANIVHNFDYETFACPFSRELITNDRALAMLAAVMIELGEHHVVINSAYRSDAWNKQVGGARNSQHRDGSAYDIDFTESNINPVQLLNAAVKAGVKSIGLYETFIHIDTRFNLWG